MTSTSPRWLRVGAWRYIVEINNNYISYHLSNIYYSPYLHFISFLIGMEIISNEHNYINDLQVCTRIILGKVYCGTRSYSTFHFIKFLQIVRQISLENSLKLNGNLYLSLCLLEHSCAACGSLYFAFRSLKFFFSLANLWL